MISELEKKMFEAARQQDFSRFKAFVFGRMGIQWACNLVGSDNGENLFEIVIDKDPKFIETLWNACLKRNPRFAKKSGWRLLKKAVETGNMPLTTFFIKRDVHRGGDNAYQNKDRYGYLLEMAVEKENPEMLVCLIQNDTVPHPSVDVTTVWKNLGTVIAAVMEPYEQAVFNAPEERIIPLPVIRELTDLTSPFETAFERAVKVGGQDVKQPQTSVVKTLV